jgi:hypothetical protein
MVKHAVNPDCSDSEDEVPKHQQHPFTRGIMTFDDYNYNQLNDFILQTAPEDHFSRPVAQTLPHDRHKSSEHFTEQNLHSARVTSHKYNHDAITLASQEQASE